MTQVYRSGAVGGLLDVYEKVITDLQQSIAAITDDLLQATVAANPAGRLNSIQAVLSHVVRAGFCYAADIRRLRGSEAAYPEAVQLSSAAEYCKALDAVFAFTLETFATIQDDGLEQADNSKKIVSSWGQVYDIEQLTEHAIAHILRHHRQVEKMKQQLAAGG